MLLFSTSYYSCLRARSKFVKLLVVGGIVHSSCSFFVNSGVSALSPENFGEKRNMTTLTSYACANTVESGSNPHDHPSIHPLTTHPPPRQTIQDTILQYKRRWQDGEKKMKIKDPNIPFSRQRRRLLWGIRTTTTVSLGLYYALR